MKKNWMQVVTLCLCGILLAMNIVQGRQLSDFQRRMENQMDHLRSDVEHEIQYISDDIRRELEEVNQLIADYTLEPNGIDKDTHSLRAVVSVKLKEWHEDTEMKLLARIGDDEISLPMISDGNGSYSSQLALPIEGNHEISLDALITGSGLTRRESLQTWGDISMLLPLRNSGGGWSGPEYKDGVMSSNFNINIYTQNGKPSPIHNPQFLTYRNGKLVQTLDAVEDPYSSTSHGVCYTVDTMGYKWSVECTEGDVIDIRFRCEDDYGLGYDFLFQSWAAEGELAESPAGSGFQSGNSPVELYWPE